MYEQRSSDWYEQRKGKFTASDIHKILGKQGLGKTGESYCFKKAIEIVFGVDEDENFESWDMRRGINLEPVAFAKFKELKYYDFIDVKPAFFCPYGEDAGASPDGLVGNDGVLEIKSPRSEKFFNLVNKGIEAIDPEYLSQMQMQMLSSNSIKAHFFNYIIFKGQPMWHEIIVERDEETIGLVKERLPQAIRLRNEYTQYLIDKKQF